ncbi:phage head-tail connector protein [Lactococcus garvieae]|uniref:phage head-tail connector protein n=1 Tax=Lactococcus garvieae TaxID=1363 RepID=UPI00254D6527|nr:phage head-tail connector protein [Lactococcus garvieae]
MEENEPKTKAIERLKTDLGVDDNKATGLIEDAVILVLDYTNQDKMLDSMWFYVRQLATVAFNRENTEGESSRSEGGVSQSFVEDIPLNIQRGLKRYRLGKVVSFYAPDET